MKKLCLIFLCLMMIASQVCFAENETGEIYISYNNTTKTVTIDTADVTTKKGASVVIIITNNPDVEDIENDSYDTIVNFIKSDNGGRVIHSEAIPEVFAKGEKYNIAIKTQTGDVYGSFMYPDIDAIEDVLEILNRAESPIDMGEKLWNNREALSIDENIFSPIKAEVGAIMYALKPEGGFSNADDYLEFYNNALAGVALQNDEDIEKTLKKYGASIGIDIKDFDALNSEEKTVWTSVFSSVKWGESKKSP